VRAQPTASRQRSKRPNEADEDPSRPAVAAAEVCDDPCPPRPQRNRQGAAVVVVTAGLVIVVVVDVEVDVDVELVDVELDELVEEDDVGDDVVEVPPKSAV